MSQDALHERKPLKTLVMTVATGFDAAQRGRESSQVSQQLSVAHATEPRIPLGVRCFRVAQEVLRRLGVEGRNVPSELEDFIRPRPGSPTDLTAGQLGFLGGVDLVLLSAYKGLGLL